MNDSQQQPGFGGLALQSMEGRDMEWEAMELAVVELGAAERGAAERGAAERGAAERDAAELGAAERGIVGTLRNWSYRAGLVLNNSRGATTAEYALLLALVVIVLIGTLKGLGNALDGRITDIIDEINGAN